MKQGNYEHRVVTHLDEQGSKHFMDMLRYYHTHRSEVVREALEFMYKHRYLRDLESERKKKVIQFELFDKAQD